MEDGWKMRKVWTMEICTASFPVLFVWIAVMDSLHLNRPGGHASGMYQDLHPSSSSSSWWVAFLQLLLGASLGLVLYALGETRSCDSTVCGPCFFLQASVDWFGWVPLPGLSWIHWYFQGSFMAAFHFTMHFPHTHLLSKGLNVVKCNLSEAKHETMLASSCHY